RNGRSRGSGTRRCWLDSAGGRPTASADAVRIAPRRHGAPEQPHRPDGVPCPGAGAQYTRAADLVGGRSRRIAGSSRRASLSLRNRVSPFGDLIATECRGTLMGNRGCLHDDQRRIRRPFALKRWILCVLEFRGGYRKVMTPGRYTELFFLDEATGLAAGHRPCAECQHGRYRLFREFWAAANGDRMAARQPSAEQIDEVLHGERLGPGRVKRAYFESLATLPAGTMVADDAD